MHPFDAIELLRKIKLMRKTCKKTKLLTEGLTFDVQYCGITLQRIPVTQVQRLYLWPTSFERVSLYHSHATIELQNADSVRFQDKLLRLTHLRVIDRAANSMDRYNLSKLTRL